MADFKNTLTRNGVPVVTTDRTLATTAPLTGGGDLSANRTLGLTINSTLQVVSDALGVRGLSITNGKTLTVTGSVTLTPLADNIVITFSNTGTVAMANQSVNFGDEVFLNSKVALRGVDAWLRVNCNIFGGVEFTNGTFTPGHFRSDGNIYTIGGNIRAFDSSSNTQVAMRVSSDRGEIFALHDGVAWKELHLNSHGVGSSSQTWIGNANGHVRSQGAFITSNGVYGASVRSESAAQDQSLILYAGSASYNSLVSADTAWSVVKPLMIHASTLGIGSSPVANNRVTIYTLGDTSSFTPLVVAATNGTTLFHIRSISTTGAQGYLAAGSWVYASDERLKEDITDLTAQRTKLKRLKPKRSRYRGSDRYNFSLVAQDVQQVYPELVDEIEMNGEAVLGIRYTELIPIMLRELVDLREEVDSLQGRVLPKSKTEEGV